MSVVLPVGGLIITFKFNEHFFRFSRTLYSVHYRHMYLHICYTLMNPFICFLLQSQLCVTLQYSIASNINPNISSIIGQGEEYSYDNRQMLMLLAFVFIQAQ